MTDVFKVFRTLGKAGVPDYASDVQREMAISRRGSGLFIPEFQEQVRNGNVFVVNEGTATTPINFAKTAYDADQPQFVIDVPLGTTIMPLSIETSLETSAGTITEVIWGAANANVGAGTSTAPTNTRNMLINASATEPATTCTGRVLYTGNGTDVTTVNSGFYEFIRHQYAFADATTDPLKRFVWNYLTDGPAPVIEGTGALVCWIDGTTTAPTGYITVKYLELNT